MLGYHTSVHGRYLKYLTKKFLKKHDVRDWLRVIASNKDRRYGLVLSHPTSLATGAMVGMNNFFGFLHITVVSTRFCVSWFCGQRVLCSLVMMGWLLCCHDGVTMKGLEGGSKSVSPYSSLWSKAFGYRVGDLVYVTVVRLLQL